MWILQEKDSEFAKPLTLTKREKKRKIKREIPSSIPHQPPSFKRQKKETMKMKSVKSECVTLFAISFCVSIAQQQMLSSTEAYCKSLMCARSVAMLFFFIVESREMKLKLLAAPPPIQKEKEKEKKAPPPKVRKVKRRKPKLNKMQKSLSVDKVTGTVEEDEDCSAKKCLKPAGTHFIGEINNVLCICHAYVL